MKSQETSGVTLTTDEDRAIATLTIAFSSDPVARWFLSDASRYLTYWPPFVKALAGNAFAAGTADSISDCGAVALWLPPDVGSDDEAMEAIAAEAVPEPDQEEVFSVIGQMGDYHPHRTRLVPPPDRRRHGKAGRWARLGTASPCCRALRP